MTKDNLRLMRSSFKKLNRIGIYLSYLHTNSFMREYVAQWDDYVYVTCKKYFYLHFKRKSKILSYKVFLRDTASIYGDFIHHKYDDDNLSMNFVKFISFNPENVKA